MATTIKRPDRVLTVFVLLSAVTVFPGMSPRHGCVEDDIVKSLQRLELTLDRYYDERGTYPEELSAAIPGYAKDRGGLSSPYSYYYRRTLNGFGYELFSVGADGAPKTLDDVVNGQPPRYCTPFDMGVSLDEYSDYGPEFLPCAIASGRISAYQRLLRTFHTDTGRYPDSLLELNSIESDGIFWRGPSMFIDPWGEPYYYARAASRYELFSYGPDGISGTSDDVVSPWVICDEPPFSRDNRNLRLGPRYRALASSAAPCAVVSRLLSLLSAEINVFRERTGRLPSTLTDLIDSDNVSEVRRLMDPWGQQYSYKRLQTREKQPERPHAIFAHCPECPGVPQQEDFELFSNGADRLPNTADDLPLYFDLEKCKRPPYDAISFQQVHAAQRSLEFEREGPSPAIRGREGIVHPTDAHPGKPIESPQGGCSFRAY